MVQRLWNLYILWISFLCVVSANCQVQNIVKESIILIDKSDQGKTPKVTPVLKFNVSSLKTAISNLNTTSNEKQDNNTNKNLSSFKVKYQENYKIASYFSTLYPPDSYQVNRDWIYAPDEVSHMKPTFIPTNNYTIKTKKNKFPIIVPGTKWCGIGDVAENDTDLGVFSNMDACCRAHANCSNYINSYETKYEIRNSEMFPIFDCYCEIELYNCLHNVNTFPSLAMAYVYFQVKENCIIYDHPLICIPEEKLSNTTQLNTTESNTMQSITTQISKIEANTEKCENYQLDKLKTPLWQKVDFKTDLPKIKFTFPTLGFTRYSLMQAKKRIG